MDNQLQQALQSILMQHRQQQDGSVNTSMPQMQTGQAQSQGGMRHDGSSLIQTVVSLNKLMGYDKNSLLGFGQQTPTTTGDANPTGEVPQTLPAQQGMGDFSKMGVQGFLKMLLGGV